jgi:hypothetical protein
MKAARLFVVTREEVRQMVPLKAELHCHIEGAPHPNW